LVQRERDWAGLQPAQAPPHCTKCNSPPINGQCTITVLLYNELVRCYAVLRCRLTLPAVNAAPTLQSVGM